MNKIILLALVSSFISLSANAAVPYGSAGCGLGNLAFGKESQVLASTTNASTYNQMFGISSGTSNCTDNGAVAMNKQLPLFVEANRVALATDIARGSGETVATLSQVMGCDNAATLATALQKNYQTIFPKNEATAQDVTGSILNVVKQADLTCKVVI